MHGRTSGHHVGISFREDIFAGFEGQQAIHAGAEAGREFSRGKTDAAISPAAAAIGAAAAAAKVVKLAAGCALGGGTVGACTTAMQRRNISTTSLKTGSKFTGLTYEAGRRQQA
jgi:hypothetical protein